MSDGALYVGTTVHERRAPTRHVVRQDLYLLLLDADAVDRPDGPTRPGGPLGPEWWWPAHYRRTDVLDGDPATPLGDAVRDLVEVRTGVRPQGPVRTLTQVRTEGYVFNPLTVHYCLSPGIEGADAPDAPPPEGVVLEVTNTPWTERHCYVVDARPGAAERTERAGCSGWSGSGPVAVGTVDERGRLRAEVPKALHVSPFMGMDQTYRLTCSPPGPRLWLRLETFERVDGEGHAGADLDGAAAVFRADLALRREPLTRQNLARRLLTPPFATYKVWLGIHAHAVALAATRVPFVPHPDRTRSSRRRVGAGTRGKVDR